MGYVDQEIESQPECWERAVDALDRQGAALPEPGARVAVIGCGTSWFMAQSYAALREAAGAGITDAFAASELPAGRTYDHLVAITRSGTTTEVLGVLDRTREQVPTVVITATAGSPVFDSARDVIVMPFADERSVVQTRFATSTLALLRASLGEDLHDVVAQARQAVDTDVPKSLRNAEQVTFLGTGWTTGLAHEAALKMREAAGAWTESYPAMEYRHGPISITGPDRAVWVFGPMPSMLEDDVRATGAHLEHRDVDPMADLIRAQRLAVLTARDRGLDPDNPRHLTRSVILTSSS
jgi:fructoselysine-6-P-deglycase FrlB-like protein